MRKAKLLKLLKIIATINEPYIDILPAIHGISGTSELIKALEQHQQECLQIPKALMPKDIQRTSYS